MADTHIKKGCAYCSDKYKCPNAFTQVSEQCGSYDNSLLPMLNLSKEDENDE